MEPNPQSRLRTLEPPTIPGLPIPSDPVLVNLIRTEPAPVMRAVTNPRRTRVVITGVGAVTPLGLTAEDLWRSLVAGKSGVRPITGLDVTQFPTKIGAQVHDFEPAHFMDAKEVRRVSRSTQFAMAAARMAWADAQLDHGGIDPDRTGVYLGTGVGGYDVGESSVEFLLKRGPAHFSPFAVGALMPNASAFHVSHALGLHGYNGTVTTACAAGTQAIGEATEVIRRGLTDVMISGGTESAVIRIGLAGFGQMRALSRRNDTPELASRPFDGERDGLVLGEGCGILILESLPHALARNAPIYAEVLGSGVSADAYHVAAPDPRGEGARKAMEWALADAHVSPDEVDYISAHATSTEAGDAAEVVAVKKVFGERAYRVPISAAKSMTGHTFGAAGALQAIACVFTLRDQVLHPTINQTTPDPQCDLDVVPNVARPARVETILSNSFGFGGQNACLVLRKYDA